jgi:hypothetical protein
MLHELEGFTAELGPDDGCPFDCEIGYVIEAELEAEQCGQCEHCVGNGSGPNCMTAWYEFSGMRVDWLQIYGSKAQGPFLLEGTDAANAVRFILAGLGELRRDDFLERVNSAAYAWACDQPVERDNEY